MKFQLSDDHSKPVKINGFNVYSDAKKKREVMLRI